MDRLLLLFLSFGLFCYFIGIFFATKTISILNLIVNKIIVLIKRLRTILLEWGDVLFILFAFLVLIIVTLYLWPRNSEFPRSDTIQLAIFLATFFTLFYSVLIKDSPLKYRNRPKIIVLFEPTQTDFYHRTTMNIFREENGVNKLIASIPTYYIRLKVKNDGKETLKNVEVVLETVEPKTTKPFMSLNLSWAGFNIPPNDIKRNVDIPQGQSRTLDVVEVMEFSSTRILFDKLEEYKDINAIRYKELSEGFRSCTISPLTRSDIYPRGSYILTLGVYAEGVEPKFIKMAIEYFGNWTEDTSDEEMQSKHLIVNVLS